MYAQAGLLDSVGKTDAALPADVERAVELDARLSADQKATLIRIYRGFID
jgi:hypothetical protein